jgi:hypothetical protein
MVISPGERMVLMPNIFGDIGSIFEGLVAGATGNISQSVSDLSSGVTGFLSGAAGQLAQAVETGFIAIFKDMWNVILGPLEVFVGASLVLLALVVVFKDDLMQVGAAFGMMAL